MGWLVKEFAALNLENQDGMKKMHLENRERHKQESAFIQFFFFMQRMRKTFLFYAIYMFSALSFDLEVEMMKERFAKLLLGEDISGRGNEAPTTLAISNVITNLCVYDHLFKFSQSILSIMGFCVIINWITMKLYSKYMVSISAGLNNRMDTLEDK
ncbi:hypothetical protein PIB30_073828 [Stylosanthes scabra]|uniref:PRONE domain-containing protein n=1 Tax=Stylosanthes scabra TaxID=79078 RepID=A0ABU6RPV9_9FABA|nr:hypothetical protein [Stylosanthes scabra]